MLPGCLLAVLFLFIHITVLSLTLSLLGSALLSAALCSALFAVGWLRLLLYMATGIR